MGSPRLEKSGLPGNKAGHASSHGDQWRLELGWTLRDGRMHCRQGGGLRGSSGVMVTFIVNRVEDGWSRDTEGTAREKEGNYTLQKK